VERMYERASRACDLVSMTPELADAIKIWAEKTERTQLLAQAIAGCETKSTLLKRRLMDRLAHVPQQQVMGILLTPKRLIWATKLGDDEAYVVSAPLPDAELTDFAESPEAAVIPDQGLKVLGRIGQMSERGTVFLGLGDDPDGRAFKEKVLEAWRAVRE